MGLAEAFGRLFGARVKSESTGGWTFLQGIDTSSTFRNAFDIWTSFSDAEREAIYGLHSIVYSCVRIISTVAGEARPIIGREGKDGFEPLAASPIADLLHRPTPDYTYEDLVFLSFSRWMLTGRSVIWKVRGRSSRRVVELWPIPTSWVSIERESNLDLAGGLIRGYKLLGVDVPPSDIIDLRFHDPADTVSALGPLQAAQRNYQIDDARQDYIVEMLENVHVAGSVLQSSKEMRALTPDQADDVKRRMRDKIGRGHRGDVIVLPYGMQYETAVPLSDLDWPGLSNMEEARICAAFGVPPILIGARVGLENSPWSNVREARRTFYDSTMLPLWRAFFSALTYGLFVGEGDNETQVRGDYSKIPELQEDATAKAERAMKLYTGGLVTQNQALEMIGLPPRGPAGDHYLRGVAIQEVPA